MTRSTDKMSRRNIRGSALTLMVLLSIILTGLVLTIAWAATVQTQSTGASLHTDKAYLAAESAAQWAVWQFKSDNTWRQNTIPSSLPTMTLGGDTYAYSVTCVDGGAAADLYWPFSEGSGLTTADASGHGNTGQLIGGVSWSYGRFGNGLLFDGTSGYVDAGNAPSTNIVSSMTMAAWVRMNSAAQDQKVGGNQDGVSGGYKMSIYGLKVEFEVRDASNNPTLNRSVSGGTILGLGVWYHVAGVFNAQAGTIKTYVNGALDRELDNVSASSLATTTGNFRMGREPWNVGAQTRYFNGRLDDIRIYSRALSDQEIKTLASTSVQITSSATLRNASYPYAPTNTVAYICASPTALPPVAPVITVGGNLPVKATSVTGNLQVSGTVTGVSASTVSGTVTYGTGYSDSHSYITINGTPNTPTANGSLTVPTINYASIQALAVSTSTGGSNQTFTFGYLDGQVNVIYVNGNVTDPVIDTSQSGGTLLINGTLTLTKNATFGSDGFPAYIICENNVSQSAGSLTLTGGLYVKGNWTHRDCTIYGDVVVTGNVTDNTQTSSSFIVGGVPWFDPRSSLPPITQPLFYTSYRGITP